MLKVIAALVFVSLRAIDECAIVKYLPSDSNSGQLHRSWDGTLPLSQVAALSSTRRHPGGSLSPKGFPPLSFNLE